jgi:hypothetical protein
MPSDSLGGAASMRPGSGDNRISAMIASLRCPLFAVLLVLVVEAAKKIAVAVAAGLGVVSVRVALQLQDQRAEDRGQPHDFGLATRPNRAPWPGRIRRP